MILTQLFCLLWESYFLLDNRFAQNGFCFFVLVLFELFALLNLFDWNRLGCRNLSYLLLLFFLVIIEYDVVKVIECISREVCGDSFIRFWRLFLLWRLWFLFNGFEPRIVVCLLLDFVSVRDYVHFACFFLFSFFFFGHHLLSFVFFFSLKVQILRVTVFDVYHSLFDYFELVLLNWCWDFANFIFELFDVLLNFLVINLVDVWVGAHGFHESDYVTHRSTKWTALVEFCHLMLQFFEFSNTRTFSTHWVDWFAAAKNEWFFWINHLTPLIFWDNEFKLFLFSNKVFWYILVTPYILTLFHAHPLFTQVLKPLIVQRVDEQCEPLSWILYLVVLRDVFVRIQEKYETHV